jgi:hypothetical protein
MSISGTFYSILSWLPPEFEHSPLEFGSRLAKLKKIFPDRYETEEI